MELRIKFAFAPPHQQLTVVNFSDGHGERLLSDFKAYGALGTPRGGTYTTFDDRMRGITYNFAHIAWIEHDPDAA